MDQSEREYREALERYARESREHHRQVMRKIWRNLAIAFLLFGVLIAYDRWTETVIERWAKEAKEARK